MPTISNLTICYEAVQRVYRNAIIRYVRESLRRNDEEGYCDLAKAPFRKEWDEILASAQERRKTGELSNELVDDIDVLGVNHFYNLFELHHKILLADEVTLHPIQAKTNRQALLGWMKAVKSLRDPLSHPSESDLSFEDAFSLLDPARRVLLKLGLTKEAADIKVWMDELSGLGIHIETAVEPLEDSLPPPESIVVDFVGRNEQIATLRDWFRNSTTRRWALAGEGGKGKSAIAYRFAIEIKFTAPEPFQMVIWLSAKRRQYIDGEIAAIANPDFANLDEALNRLMSVYGWSEFNEQDTPTKKTKVMELLDNFPALIVVDDADSLEVDSEDAAEFFTFDVPRTKSKVLLTSRRVLFGLGNVTTHVSGLQGQEAADFISSRCRLAELDMNVLKPHMSEMLKVTEGSPLYLEDLIRLCAVLPVNAAIAAWKERSGDKAREYALGRELEMLSPRAQQILLAFCIPSKPVSHYEIEAMTGFSTDEIGSTLKELQKLFLVPKPALYEGEQRFNVNVNTRLLVRKALGALDSYRRIYEAYENITKGNDASNDEVVAVAIRRASFQVRSGNVQDAETTLLTALQRRPNQGNLLGFLGWVYKAAVPQRTTDAREQFKRAAQLACKDLDMYRHWSRMELEHREWANAAEAAEKGLDLLGSVPTLENLAGYARSRLGRELAAGLHTEKADSELQKAKKHLRAAIKRKDNVKSEPDVYRAMILTCEGLNASHELSEYFDLWFTHHPDDPNFKSEWYRLATRFGFDHERYSQWLS